MNNQATEKFYLCDEAKRRIQNMTFYETFEVCAFLKNEIIKYGSTDSMLQAVHDEGVMRILKEKL